MPEWNEEDAGRLLTESLDLVAAITKRCRESMMADSGALTDDVQRLHDLVSSLKPHEVGGSRQDGSRLTRQDVRSLLAICGKLQRRLDVATSAKMSAHLLAQTEALMKMMKAVKADFRPVPQGEDWEDYLSTEQVVTVMGWVEQAKSALRRATAPSSE